MDEEMLGVYVKHPTKKEERIPIDQFERYLENFIDEIAEAAELYNAEPFSIARGEDVFEGLGRAAITIKIPFMDEKDLEVDVTIDTYFTYSLPDFLEKGSYIYYVDEVEEYLLVDVSYDNMSLINVYPEYGLYSASEIAEVLSFFLRRWCILGDRILLVSAYMDTYGYRLLTESSEYLKEGNIYVIVTKSRSNFKHFKKFLIYLEEEKKKRIEELEEKEYSPRIESMIDSIVDYYSELQKLFKERVYIAKNFHAKLYTAYLNRLKYAEVIITSLNLIESELKNKKLESFAFLRKRDCDFIDKTISKLKPVRLSNFISC